MLQLFRHNSQGHLGIVLAEQSHSGKDVKVRLEDGVIYRDGEAVLHKSDILQ